MDATGIPLNWFLILSACLFVIGLAGVLIKRNAIVVLMSIELMLNAANINLVAFSVYNNDPTGQVLALFSIGLAAAEVAIGLAILLNLNRLRDTVDLNDLTILRW
ncbi:MAG: F(420)H(2) dehydrogenase subunit K [Methanomassiliicoccales archaeon PtaU1.Bin124]|nr:MAG: F(420)H(2) dehydrogenase subunit K [Methanomassiliicoccales archaeon PtaU1.Bin124]